MNFFLKLIVSLFFTSNVVQSSFIYKKDISQFVLQYPATKVIQCTKNYPFFYPEFPLYQKYKEKYFPNKGVCSDIFVLEIPYGVAHIHSYGFVFVNNVFIQETQLKNLDPLGGHKVGQFPEYSNVKKVSGRVAVVNHLYAYTYGIFILDILGTLALLELYGIKYDYLWIPYNKEFIKQALDIWGIDSSKIIPLEHGQTLQADMIILPTSISQNSPLVLNVNYYPDFLLKYIREKMIAGVARMNIQMDFAEKIFISRKDAAASRKIPNEDEVFKLFEPLGYQRFEFSKFSMAEKIAMTYHAKSIVSFVGSGSTNILFASSDVKFYDIFHVWVEATFFYIAKTFNLHYGCINASSYADLVAGMPWSKGRTFPLHFVQDFIQQHPEL